MFKFSEKHIEEYETLGYTVFKNIVPAKLVDELRRECDIAAAEAREKQGANTQRFQPVAKFDVNLKPFEEFRDLPAVRDAVSQIIPGSWEAAGPEIMGVLLEPANDPYCTAWHRDWRDNVPGLDPEVWEKERDNRLLFNQVNCALYEDSCTWFVPGSHFRNDTDDEVRRFPTRPIHGPDLTGLTAAQREYACLQYCESLPNARRLLLDAGDYCLYRNSLWHLGNYIPYRKRATLHDGIMTPEFRKWWDTMPAIAGERTKVEGYVRDNPNEARLEALQLV